MLCDILNLQLGKLINTSICKSTPSPICAIFSVNTDVDNHNARQYLEPHILTISSSKISKTFIHIAPKFRFDLPSD